MARSPLNNDYGPVLIRQGRLLLFVVMQTLQDKALFQSATPLVPAGKNLAAELDFYVKELGFSLVWQNGAMAGVKRDTVAFNLIANDTQLWVENASFSIGVSNLETLYEEYRHVSGLMGKLEMKAWGRREFHLIAPSGVCFQFYQLEAS